MSDPLALLPLALAAGGGRVDGHETQQLVAAGLTLLQRSAPLVRALSGRRSAILLDTSPRFLTALSASDGRGAVLVSPLAAPPEIAFQCRDADVGAIFTVSSFATRLPPGLPAVFLDDAPRSARVVAGDRAQVADLGAHHGLSLQGERDVAGRDEEAVIVYTQGTDGTPLGAVLTHANLLANARSTRQVTGVEPSDHALALLPFANLLGLVMAGAAPLLAGARLTTMEKFTAGPAAELLAGDVTQVVGVPAVFHALLDAIARRGMPVRDGALRLCVCGGPALSVELQDRWADVTGVELRQCYGRTEAGPVCLFNRVDRPNVRGAMGVHAPGVEVAILPPSDYAAGAATEERTDAVADGEEGEICVRGASVSPGYVRNGHLGLPRRGGWLCTGDRGVRDANGSVRFRGRLST